MKKTLLLLSACLFSLCAVAQETTSETEEFETDRPGQGNSSTIVPPGNVQVEAGYWYQKEKTTFGTFKEMHYPETELRIGIIKVAELRFRGQITRTSASISNPFFQKSEFTETGLDDIMAGTKIQLCKGKKLLPEIALQADFKLPIGDEAFKSEKVEPKLRLALSNELTEKLSLQYNIGLEWEENNDPEISNTFNHTGLYTLALDYEFTDDFKAFVEAFGEKQEDQDFQHSLDAGFAYKIRPNLQADVYGGFGLSEDAPDTFISAGISFRLPH